MDKALGNTSEAIVKRFIKPRASTMFGHPVYSLYGPGPSIAVSGPHEEYFNINFDLWIGGKNVSDGCLIPIRVHEVCRSLGLRQLRL